MVKDRQVQNVGYHGLGRKLQRSELLAKTTVIHPLLV